MVQFNFIYYDITWRKKLDSFCIRFNQIYISYNMKNSIKSVMNFLCGLTETQIQSSTEKFIGWPRYSQRMEPNEVYFSTLPHLWSTLLLSVLQCLDPRDQKVITSRYDVSSWTYQVTLIHISYVCVSCVMCAVWNKIWQWGKKLSTFFLI